jgi:hypothetical protein
MTADGVDTVGVVDGHRFNIVTGRHELVLRPDGAPGMIWFFPEPLTVRLASESTRVEAQR